MTSNIEKSTQTIEINEQDNLLDLRQQIQQVLNIPIQKQILKLKHDGISVYFLYNQIRLVNGFDFNFYEIKDKTVLWLEVIQSLQEKLNNKNEQINKKYIDKLGMNNFKKQIDFSTNTKDSPQLGHIPSFNPSNVSGFSLNDDKLNKLMDLKRVLENSLKNLIKFTKEGDWNSIQDIFSKDVDISLKSEYEQEVKYLMNVIGSNGWNALHYACYLGQTKIVADFIKRGAVINKLSLEGWTPLQLATKKNHLEVVKLLVVEKELDINLITPKGSALHIASSQGKIQILNLLLQNKANPSISLQNGQTALDVSYNQEIYILIKQFENIQEKKTNIVKQPTIKQAPYKIQGYLHKVGRFQIALNYRYFVLDPIEGTLFRCSKKEDYPHRPLEIVSLRDIFSVQRIKKSWYMKKKIFFFEIQYSSRMQLGSLNENIANIWVNSIVKSCLYANQLHEIYTNETSHKIIGLEQNKIIELENETPQELKSDAEMIPYKKFVISQSFQFRSTQKLISRKVSLKLQFNPINYKSFDFLKVLGQGTFGKVYMVRKKESGNIYAAKVLKKSFLAQKNITKYALTEARIMHLESDFPFILKLHHAFQTQEYLYMILDYCEQGDLYKALIQVGYFEENVAKFYIAELILAIDQLHQKDIIYRDLKPENILLKDGHVVLADYGLCKEGMNNGEKSKSFCGSPAYFSPELLQNKGTDKKSDIYSIGIVLYELLKGESPYHHHNNKQMFKQIVKGDLQFPRYISQEAQDFITKLLKKDPDERPSIIQIKEDPFFQEVDWNQILNRQYEAPSLDFLHEIEFSQGRVNFIDYDYNENNALENYIYGFDINTQKIN